MGDLRRRQTSGPLTVDCVVRTLSQRLTTKAPLKRGVAIALILLPAGAAWYISTLPAFHPSGRRPIDAPAALHSKYASQTGSRRASRAADIRWAGLELQDSASEVCEGRSVDDWARLLNVSATPAVVARAFARRNYSAAYWAAAESGCLSGLKDRD